jgi:hypothetical protein
MPYAEGLPYVLHAGPHRKCFGGPVHNLISSSLGVFVVSYPLKISILFDEDSKDLRERNGRCTPQRILDFSHLIGLLQL